MRDQEMQRQSPWVQSCEGKNEAGNKAKTRCNGRIKPIARRARCVDAVIAGDLVLGWDARRRRGTHRDRRVVLRRGRGCGLYGRIFVWENLYGRGRRGASLVWGEGQAAFLLWAGDWECGLRRERAHAPNGLKSYHPHNFRTHFFFSSRCAGCTLRLEG